jgi:hypothetical protein
LSCVGPLRRGFSPVRLEILSIAGSARLADEVLPARRHHRAGHHKKRRGTTKQSRGSPGWD